MKTVFSYIWEYRVKQEHIQQFETAYKPEGTWVQLFQKGEGYLYTELHRDINAQNRYMTIDFWKTEKHRDRFQKEFAKEFAVLDKFCEDFTISETFIGDFNVTVPEKLTNDVF